MENRRKYLPIGGHILPEEFQEHLISWNSAIESKTTRWWTEKDARDEFKKNFPEEWDAFRQKFLELSKLYKSDVLKTKEFQKRYEEQKREEMEYLFPTCESDD